MEGLLVFEFLVELTKYLEEHSNTSCAPIYRRLRDCINPFDISERLFKRNFRMPQYLAIKLIQLLEPYDRDLSSPIPFSLKVLTTLNFFAKGSYQNAVGQNNTINLSQSSVSRSVTQISRIITEHLGVQFIVFPKETSDIEAVKERFQEKFGIAHTIGCIDCTHVAIVRPPDNDPTRPARLYRNRKRFYSINVEAICDANLKFLWVNAKFPGSCHDSGIWALSQIKQHLYRNSNGNWLLGDAGYPLEPWLLTPYAGPAEKHEEDFNAVHIMVRNTIERAFGWIKSVFRCLLKHRTLHYAPSKACSIINACFIIYNFLKHEDFDLHELDIEELDIEENIFSRPDSEYQSIELLIEGSRIRDDYARSLTQ